MNEIEAIETLGDCARYMQSQSNQLYARLSRRPDWVQSAKDEESWRDEIVRGMSPVFHAILRRSVALGAFAKDEWTRFLAGFERIIVNDPQTLHEWGRKIMRVDHLKNQ